MQTPTSDRPSSHAVFRSAIGERLRLVRARLGENQTQFGERMGVTKLSVLSYEAGDSCPRVDQLCVLESHGIDAAFIAFGTPSLGSAQARQQFAATLAWVRRECKVASLDVSEAGMVDAAWLVFTELSRQTGGVEPPDDAALKARVQAAVHDIAG